MSGWFITGTGTDVGKTFVARALLADLRAAGEAAVGMKPVASGCYEAAQGLRSADAEALLAASSVAADYADVNPYAFAPAVAPHLAAAAVGVAIDIENIAAHFARLQRLASRVVVEGAGGWLTPLDARRSMADIALRLKLPVILVVGLRLGCLNHALLTARAIRADGAPLAGWVANRLDPAMALVEENLATLAARIEAPLLGVFPHQSPRSAPPAGALDLRRLTEIV